MADAAPPPDSVQALIIGAGPAGLSAAARLAAAGVAKVLVVDRDSQAGGVPRHCHHGGFGLLSLGRPLSGPRFARQLARRAARRGCTVALETTVVARETDNRWLLSSPAGLTRVRAECVLLAVGCRERPRSARLVPGVRVPSIYTTGSLQQLVHLQQLVPGRRAVVVGAEHVSFSAVQTLARAGTQVVAMVDRHPRDQTFRWYRWLTAGRRRIERLQHHEVVGIDRCDGALLVRVRATGASAAANAANAASVAGAAGAADDALAAGRRIACDTVVFTGDWVPDYELARTLHLTMDHSTRGPTVDEQLRTSAPGIFAAGNAIHGAETADMAATEGSHAARAMACYLVDPQRRWPSPTAGCSLTVEPPLAWVQPQRLTAPAYASQPLGGRLLLRAQQFRGPGTLLLERERDSQQVPLARLRRLIPNRRISVTVRALPPLEDGGSMRIRYQPD